MVRKEISCPEEESTGPWANSLLHPATRSIAEDATIGKNDLTIIKKFRKNYSPLRGNEKYCLEGILILDGTNREPLVTAIEAHADVPAIEVQAVGAAGFVRCR